MEFSGLVQYVIKKKISCEGFADLIQDIASRPDPLEYVALLGEIYPNLRVVLVRALNFMADHTPDNVVDAAFMACSI